jgi:hypothetical protein
MRGWFGPAKHSDNPTFGGIPRDLWSSSPGPEKEMSPTIFCLPRIAIAFSAQMRNITAAEILRSVSSLWRLQRAL